MAEKSKLKRKPREVRKKMPATVTVPAGQTCHLWCPWPEPGKPAPEMLVVYDADASYYKRRKRPRKALENGSEIKDTAQEALRAKEAEDRAARKRARRLARIVQEAERRTEEESMIDSAESVEASVEAEESEAEEVAREAQDRANSGEQDSEDSESGESGGSDNAENHNEPSSDLPTQADPQPEPQSLFARIKRGISSLL